jgi:DNA invertase Pin-like site-specific DNA recombinase
MATTTPATGTPLGYARVSTGHQSLDHQIDALFGAGVDVNCVYSDKLSSRPHARSALALLRCWTTHAKATPSS